MCLYLRAGKKEKDGKTIKEECALWKQRADKKGRMAAVSGVGRCGSHACLLFVLLQILFHCLVHDVFQRHVLLDGEEFHTGMNAFVDDEVAMNRRFFFRGGCYRLFSVGSLFVGDSNPSSPPFMLSFSKSLLLILGLF